MILIVYGTSIEVNEFSLLPDVTRNDSIADSMAVVASTVGQHGLNCLINNAGVLDEYTTIEGITQDSLNFLLQTNAVGPAVLTKVRFI